VNNISDEELEGASWGQSMLSRNDPDYAADISKVAADVRTVANQVGSVEIVAGRDPHIAIRMTDRNNHPKLRHAGSTIGKLFEAPVYAKSNPQTGDSGPITQDRQPWHRFVKDQRRER
jgi:hypothetical protein